MKKLLQNLINNQTGSMFIYLFFLSTLLLIFTLTIFHQFQNEQEIAALELEHMQLNMIHQQTYQTLLTNWDEIYPKETVSFSFPNGQASVIISNNHQDYYNINITAFSKPPHQKLKTYHLKKESLNKQRD